MKNLGKFLSLILRHKPERVGIYLDSSGWVNIEALICGLRKVRYYEGCCLSDIVKVVNTDEKARYSIRDGMIRANQGHSIDVDLNLKAVVPPDILYHGTTERFYSNIMCAGLMKMARHHVHLTDSVDNALSVGSRRGTPLIFKIETRKMYDDGCLFFLSENNVWLTDYVNSKYLSIVV